MTLLQFAQAAQVVSTIAICISACVAILVLRWNGAAARRRATFDMILKTFIDRSEHNSYADFKTMLRAFEREGRSLVELLEETPENRDHRTALMKALNDYEFISLGIRRKIFDEKLYKRWFRTAFCRDYERMRPFIRELQQRSDSFACEYTALYRKWRRRALFRKL